MNIRGKLRGFILHWMNYPFIKDFDIRQQIKRDPISQFGSIEPIDFTTPTGVKVMADLTIDYPCVLQLPVSQSIKINGKWYNLAGEDEIEKLEKDFKNMEIFNPGRQRRR